MFLRQSLRENLALGPRLRGVPKAETNERINEPLVCSVSHTSSSAGPITSPRGGEGRRASVARALCLQGALWCFSMSHSPDSTLRPTGRLLDELPQVLGAFGGDDRAGHARPLRGAPPGPRILVALVGGRVHAAGWRQTRRGAQFSTERRSPRRSWAIRNFSSDGRRVAVRVRRSVVCTGSCGFSMVVEEFAGSCSSTAVLVGCIGKDRVHVAALATAEMPLTAVTG